MKIFVTILFTLLTSQVALAAEAVTFESAFGHYQQARDTADEALNTVDPLNKYYVYFVSANAALAEL